MNTLKSTTDLEVLRKRPHLFTWGRIVKIHDISCYTIVEFIDRLSHDISAVSSPRFHVYVNGVSTSNSCSTLEGALVFAIARKNLEANEARYMSMAVTKILGIKEEV